MRPALPGLAFGLKNKSNKQENVKQGGSLEMGRCDCVTAGAVFSRVPQEGLPETWCYGLSISVPQNSYVETCSPNVMVLGGNTC